MGNYIKKAELAAQLGVSRQAINWAIKKGKVVLDGMGRLVDLDHELTRHYIEAARDRQNGRKQEGVPLGKEANVSQRGGAKSAKRSKKEPPTEPERAENVQVLARIDPPSDELQDFSSDAPLEQMSKHSLDRMKIIEQVIALKVKTEEKRRELVSSETSRTVWAKVYAVHTSELGPLGEKIAADVAALCGVDDSEGILNIKQAIDNQVYTALKHIKRLIDDFLDEIGKGGLDCK